MAPRKASEKEVTAPTKRSARVASQVQQRRETEASLAASLAASIPAPTTKKSSSTSKSKKVTADKVTKTTTTKSKKGSVASKASKASKTSKTSKSTKMSSTTAKPTTKKSTTKKPTIAKKASIAIAASKITIPSSLGKRNESPLEGDLSNEENQELDAKPTKKVKTTSTASKIKAPAKRTASKKSVTKAVVELPVINKAPTKVLQYFVFGENSSGELGLGHMNTPGKRIIDVKRPRLNHKLSADEVGVVQLDCGGMHVVALTRDNKILTWGVNDQGALGRVTKGGELDKSTEEKEKTAAEEKDPMHSGLSAIESSPAEIDLVNIPKDTVFTKVAAGDSITMVLTSTGLVYGCGTFRSNEGVLGFSKTVEIQYNLTLISGLKNIVDFSCGTNHVLALDNKGHAYAFGSGQQNQLGRRIVERTKLNSLVPTALSIPRTKVTAVSTGAYHSFALDTSGRVWSWGLNSFGQTGHSENAGSDGGAVMTPTLVESLKDSGIKNISGGSQHSIAVNGKGECLVWGRCDGKQIGQYVDEVPEANFYHDNKGVANKRLLLVPTALEYIGGVTLASASGDTSLVINAQGEAYSWGFSANYQTGQGTHEDVVEATQIENSAIKDEKLVWCGLGGQFGMVASYAKESKSEVEVETL